MKIALDTNAYYAFMGISKDINVKQDKFRELLSNPDNEVAISTVTIYEFLVKYENDIRTIRKGISFTVNRIDKIHNYGKYLPLSSEEINSLLLCSDEQIHERVRVYKERKIEIESRFSALFLGYLLIQYTLSYMFEKQTKTEIEQTILKLSQRCIPETIRVTQEQLTSILRNGYSINKAKKLATDNFNSMLVNRLSSWSVFLEFIENNQKTDLNENELFAEFMQLYNNSRHVRKIYKYADNINEWIAKYDNLSRQNASNGLLLIWRKVFELKGIHGIQIDYMEWKLSNMGQQKKEQKPSKFRKNDISDMLILTVLNDSDSILIAVDKDVRKFIVHTGNKSRDYINSVYMTQI